MYCGCAADIVPLCDVMPGRRPASTELPSTGAEQFLCWGRGRPQVATEQVLLFPPKALCQPPQHEHQFVEHNSCGRFAACAHRPSPPRPSSPKPVFSYHPAVHRVEDIPSRQHLANAGHGRPLVAALLTSLLTTEHRHELANAALGTAFSLRCRGVRGTAFSLRCRGVRSCVNPTSVRPPDLFSGGLIYREDLFALVALREFAPLRQPQLFRQRFSSVVLQHAIHVSPLFDPIKSLRSRVRLIVMLAAWKRRQLVHILCEPICFGRQIYEFMFDGAGDRVHPHYFIHGGLVGLDSVEALPDQFLYELCA